MDKGEFILSRGPGKIKKLEDTSDKNIKNIKIQNPKQEKITKAFQNRCLNKRLVTVQDLRKLVKQTLNIVTDESINAWVMKIEEWKLVKYESPGVFLNMFYEVEE